ncbi:hypothetical protein D9V87_04575 [Bacteroidetes/Chlorobi group bacterium MS-B_bin-24]|nr:MAG: hypothetical protein D9V87_04575 [Bacteroidetes/Chlorobi group bacterium MS-B_bin-24]
MLRELIELLAIKSLVKDTKSTLSFYFISLTFPTNIFPFFEKHLRFKINHISETNCNLGRSKCNRVVDSCNLANIVSFKNIRCLYAGRPLFCS